MEDRVETTSYPFNLFLQKLLWTLFDCNTYSTSLIFLATWGKSIWEMYTGVLEIAFTLQEKVHIAMTHLLPKQRRVSAVPMSTNPMRRLLTFSQATILQKLDGFRHNNPERWTKNRSFFPIQPTTNPNEPLPSPTNQPILSLYPGVHGLEKDPEAEAARLNQGTPAEAREPAPEPLPELDMKLGSKGYQITC